MNPLGAVLRKLAEALLRVTEEPQRPPKEVEEALSHDYGDVAEWKQRGGGIAPPDAPHIDDDGAI